MNCGKLFWRTLLFLQKFIPSQDVSIYAKEKLLHLEIRMLHWCLPYTLFMATYVGPGFPHTSTSFSRCASLQALCHSSGTSIYYSNNCVPVFCFFGAEEEQRSVFGVLDMLCYLLHQWQFHIKPVPARLSPLHHISPTAMSYSGRLCCAHQNFCCAPLLWLYGQLNAELILFWECFCLVWKIN